MLSYQTLEKSLGFDKTLPVTEHWSAAADFLTAISGHCLQEKPETIVECSSGTSSLILSQCCKLNRCGHVYSLENAAQFAEQTRGQLADFFLSNFCDVLQAPLSLHSVSDEEFQWYACGELPQAAIDLLVIDGPPGFIQKYSRYPALPLLYERLAEHCTIYLDDAARDDEQAIIKRWLELYPEFHLEYLNNERGCAILKR